MYCNKCGLPIEENETKCPNCGTEINKEELTTELSETTVEVLKEKKKLGKKGICIIAGTVVGIVAVLLFVLNFAVISNAVRRTVTSPASYYRYVEKKNTTKAVQNAVTGVYEQMPKEWNHFYSDNTMTITLNDYVLNLASALTGMNNLSWLQHIGMTATVSMQEEMMESNLSVMLGEEAMLSASPLVSLQTIYDLNKEMVYVQIPELSKSYMGMQFANMENAQIPNIQEWYDVMLTEEEIQKLIQRYSTIFLANVQLVEKSESVVTALDLTKDVYALTVTLDATTMKTAFLDVIEEAKEDKVILEFLQNFDNIAANAEFSFYNSFMNVLEKSEAELIAWNVENETEYLLMQVYVDERGTICGRDVSLCAASGETEVFSYAFVQDGTSIALEGIFHGSINCSVNGTGKIKKNTVEGELVCSVNGEKFLQIDLENFKLTKLIQGNMAGTVKMKLLDGVSNALGLNKDVAFLLAVFSDYFLQIDLNVEEQMAAYTYSLRDDSVSYITVTLHSNIGTPTMTPPAPTDVILVEEEAGVNEWLKTIDLEKVKKHLQTTPLPEEWISLIEIFAEQLQTMPIQ